MGKDKVKNVNQIQITVNKEFIDSLLKGNPPSKLKTYGGAKAGLVRGLLLYHRPSGSVSWVFKYFWNKKEVRYTLGDYNGTYEGTKLTVAGAIEVTNRLRAMVKDGVNPAEIRKKEAEAEEAKQQNTLNSFFPTWFEGYKFKKDGTLKTQKTLDATHRYTHFVLDRIGDTPMANLTTVDCVNVIEDISKDHGKGLGVSIFGHLQRMLAEASVRGIIPVSPIAGVTPEAFNLYRPKPKHHEGVKMDQLGDLVRKFKTMSLKPQTLYAVLLTLHTMLRQSETRKMKWEHIDFEDRLIRLPDEIMKMRKMHVLPMSDQVFNMLQKVHKISSNHSSGFVFPGVKGKGLASLAHVFRRCELGTIHGLRSTASTYLNNTGLFDSENIEMCLAHYQEGVAGVYDRGYRIEPRRVIYQHWSDRVTMCETFPSFMEPHKMEIPENLAELVESK